ncbi:MAG TPA: peptidyl-prolyl cis-trans isomerase [bacterium]|nr:peptidyl-prolyl cis-trans isomerase [bacterium]
MSIQYHTKGGATRRRPFCFLLAVLLMALAACAPKAEPLPPDAMALVNGEPITVDEFATQFAASLAARAESAPADPLSRLALRRAFLDRLIDHHLIAQEAAKNRLAVADEEVDRILAGLQSGYEKNDFANLLSNRNIAPEALREHIRFTLLADKLAAQAVLPSVEISEDALRAYYDDNREDFVEPERVRARQIVCVTHPEAVAALTELLTGKDFTQVARERSLAPEAAKGGELGWFGRDEMLPEIEEEAFRLVTGEISNLIQTIYGVHILQMLDKAPAVALTFAQARATIHAKLRTRAADEAWRAYLQGLREKAVVRIDIARLPQS